MKLFLYGPLLFVSSLSIFNFSYKLDHVRQIFLSLPKSTFVSSVYVEEAKMTPRFNYDKARKAVNDYFVINLRSNTSWDYTLVFINLDTGQEVVDNFANELHITFSAKLLLQLYYQQTLIVTLRANDA